MQAGLETERSQFCHLKRLSPIYTRSTNALM